MNQLSRILAAVDFSRPARVAFDHALALCRRHGAALAVVHAIPTNEPMRWHAHERVALINELRRAAEAARVALKVVVQQGDPAAVIRLHARSRRPDLIVLGTHQRTGLDRLLAGSIAEAVTLRATVPVLVVPASEHVAPVESASCSVRIVVAVDFSETSRRAVEEALSLTSCVKGRVTLLHVVPGPSHANIRQHVYRFHEAEYQLQDLIPAPSVAGVDIHARVVTGDPAREISRVASEIGAGVLVIGVTSRGALARGILGSTSTRVMRLAGCPVVAVPAPTPRKAVDPAEADQNVVPA